ncbi:MAG: HlyD family efflux transporter periplasmic adaptor subunit [Candidatus Omnitrophota bacterium]
MMKKHKILIMVLVFIAAGAFFMMNKKQSISEGGAVEEIKPFRGNILSTIPTTGVVEPQNRLEIKPSINGRIEEILVYEGDHVKKGDILAWMSSTERAALLDAALAQGEEAVKYWQDVYKASPLISPINGEVIVRAVEPGQTVTSADPVLVLSDRLIVSAQFDETDIGRVKKGQETIITLDAYPEIKIIGLVDHIAYESQLINNVTIYDVDIAPKKVPPFFRSGMSVNVEVIENKRKNVLLIPVEAVRRDEKRAYVLIKKLNESDPEERDIKVGLSDETNIEVVTGLAPGDIISMASKASLSRKKQTGTNPFMASHR